MVKKGYYGNDGLSLAWDIGINFLGIPNLWFGRMKEKFFLKIENSCLTGIIEKCGGSFLLYPFLRVLIFFVGKKGIAGWGF